MRSQTRQALNWFTVVLLLATYPVLANECVLPIEPPTCSNGPYKGVAFIGELIASDPTPLGSQKAMWRVTLRILEAFQGVPPNTKTIKVDVYISSPEQQKGRKYLVRSKPWAPKDGVLFVQFGMAMCGSPMDEIRPVEYSQLDIQFLRESSRGQWKPAVAGELFQRFEIPLTGTPITLETPTGTQTTVSDLQGRFQFTNLASGTYRLRISAPGFTMTPPPPTELQPNGGCNWVPVVMTANAAMRVRVLDRQGRPVKGVGVSVETDAYGEQRTVGSAKSDAAGYAVFSELPSTTYVVAVNANQEPEPWNPFPTTYLGGTNMKNATRIFLPPQGKRTDLYIRVRHRIPTRRITILVLDKDGNPLPMAQASAWTSLPALTDSSGTARVEAFAGRALRAQATWLVPADARTTPWKDRKRYLAQMPIPAGYSDVAVTLRLKSWITSADWEKSNWAYPPLGQ